MAEAYLTAGRPETAATLAREALAVADRVGERVFVAGCTGSAARPGATARVGPRRADRRRPGRRAAAAPVRRVLTGVEARLHAVSTSLPHRTGA
ncbi:hypothetical protein V2I01_32135 [Micromonospora sp. BRA006-A]|nr:hypothetical protein [Micromonospora sp. BRA006-A]